MEEKRKRQPLDFRRRRMIGVDEKSRRERTEDERRECRNKRRDEERRKGTGNGREVGG